MKDRILPQYKIRPSYVEYMKVADVLNYLQRNIWCTQYTLFDKDKKPLVGNYFKCDDLKTKLSPAKYKLMECEVIQYLIEIK